MASIRMAPSVSVSLLEGTAAQVSSHEPQSSKRRPKISKKQNARMQLAAALIEADNDAIQKRAEQALAATVATQPNEDDQEPLPRPPPAPQPKLASESVIFSPFRADGPTELAAPTRARSVQRPQSRDFLGVSLPGENRPITSTDPLRPDSRMTSHNRAVSIISSKRAETPAASSRPASILEFDRPSSSLGRPGSASGFSEHSKFSARPVSLAVDEQAQADRPEEDALGEWGLDKFLSTDARNKIAANKERQRAVSNPDLVQSEIHSGEGRRRRKGSGVSVQSLSGLTRPPSPGGSSFGAPSTVRAHSDIVRVGSNTGRTADVDLLARIKLYRERQENLPIDQWGERVDPTSNVGRPPAQANPDAAAVGPERGYTDGTAESVEILEDQEGTPSLPREGFVAQRQAELNRDHDNGVLHRRQSSKGYLGESWSEQGSEMSHATEGGFRLLSGSKTASQHGTLEPTKEEEQLDSALDDASDELPFPSMAGVGSFSRSNSFGQLQDTEQAPQGSADRLTMLTLPTSFKPQSSSPLVPRTPSPEMQVKHLPVAASEFSRLAALSGDPFATLALGPSAYPAPNRASGLFLGDTNMDDLSHGKRPSTAPTSPFFPSTELAPATWSGRDSDAAISSSNAGLSTRQLQELARQSAFPEHYGISTPFMENEKLDEEVDDTLTHQMYGLGDLPSVTSLPADGWVPERTPGLLSRTLKGTKVVLVSFDKLRTDVAKLEPDLSSIRWAQKKRKWNSELRQDDDVPAEKQATRKVETNLPHQSITSQNSSEPHPDVELDDEYLSPPRGGPLKPRGLEACLPEVLVMPELLEGSPAQPRSRLSDTVSGSHEDQARRSHGLYVPDGFVLHDGKGLPPIQMNTNNGRQRMTFIYPTAAPEGIGRRANMGSTALFRNQLVQHEEEREGWGWELSSAPKVEDADAAETQVVHLSKKQIRKAQKAASKEAKVRLKRKRARALRRRLRAEAQQQGKSCAELGVPDESPAEDLSLTEDSEGDLTDSDAEDDDGLSWHSEDERRWVDESKPAGKLFGKSLMDVAEERKRQQQANRRYYGQQELQEIERAEKVEALLGAANGIDGQSVMGQSIAARSFRDNPLGYNDTRERMEATFGRDVNWSREMQKRRQLEAEEAEIARLAEIELTKIQQEKAAKKAARKQAQKIFRRNKKGKLQAEEEQQISAPATVDPEVTPLAEVEMDAQAPDNELSRRSSYSLRNSATQPYPSDQRKPPKLDIGWQEAAGSGRKSIMGVDEWLLPSSSESSDDSDSDIGRTIAKAREKARLSLALNRNGIAAEAQKDHHFDPESSDEDEVPLSQLKRRPLVSVTPKQRSKPAFPDSSDEEEVVTLAEFKRRSLARPEQVLVAPGHTKRIDSSDEEMPLARLQAKNRQSRQSLSNLLSDSNRLGHDPQASLTLDGVQEQALDKPDVDRAHPATQDSDDSDADRPLGLRQGAAAALAAAVEAQKHNLRLQKLEQRRSMNPGRAGFAASSPADGTQPTQDQIHGNENESSASDEDVPLGAAHPQAAIIARQAALIKRLKAEAEQARMQPSHFASPFPSMHPGYFMPPKPMLPLGRESVLFGQHLNPMPSPGSAHFLPAPDMPPDPNGHTLSVAPPSDGPVNDGMSRAQMQLPMSSGQFLDPKGQSIDRWRNGVLPPSATTSASATPSTLSAEAGEANLQAARRR